MMMNELVALNDEIPIARRVNSLHAKISRDDFNSDTLPAPLSAQVRADLQNHHRNLHAKLRPISGSMTDRDKAAKAIAAFLQCYLNAKSHNPALTLAAYTSTIFDQPLFALMAALDDFRNGRVFDINQNGEKIPFTIDYAPSAPRLLAQVKKCAADVQEENFRVKRLLAVKKIGTPQVSDAERERVGALMRELADHMAMKSEKIRVEEQQKIRDEAQQARDRTKKILNDARRHNEAANFASLEESAR